MNKTLCLRTHRASIIVRIITPSLSMLFCAKCQAFR